MQHRTLTSARRMEYGRVERVLSSKLRRTPPATADRVGVGGGLARRPLPPAPGVIGYPRSLYSLPTPPLPSPCSAVDDRSAQFRWLSCGRRRLLINGQQYRIGCHGRKKYRPIPDNPIPVSFEPY